MLSVVDANASGKQLSKNIDPRFAFSNHGILRSTIGSVLAGMGAV